jgi:hypothetical protein
MLHLPARFVVCYPARSDVRLISFFTPSNGVRAGGDGAPPVDRHKRQAGTLPRVLGRPRRFFPGQLGDGPENTQNSYFVPFSFTAAARLRSYGPPLWGEKRPACWQPRGNGNPGYRPSQARQRGNAPGRGNPWKTTPQPIRARDRRRQRKPRPTDRRPAGRSGRCGQIS